jgi:kynurenine formamidase
VFDLSQPVENGMTVFPGDPEPRIGPAEATPPWQVSSLSIGSHTGTHIDAASHYYPNGTTIDRYEASRFVLPGIVARLLDLPDDTPITAAQLDESLRAAPAGGAILLNTGWDRFWKTARYLRHPYLTAEAAELIAAAQLRLVGIDALNPDSTVQGTSHAHEILLRGDVLIVENLTRLEQLQAGRIYGVSVLPIKLANLDGSPVRAIAWEA